MTTFQGQLKSLQDNQKLLGLLLFSLITVVIWISISLVTSQKKTVISEESKALAKPLNPSINTEVLDEIAAKRQYPVTELESFPIYILYNERGNASIFDSNNQTVTVQPATLGNLNQTPEPASESASFTVPSPQPSPTPDATVPPTTP